MKKLLPVLVAIISVVGGGAFYGGMKYDQSKSSHGRFSRVDSKGVASQPYGAGFQNLSPEERQQRIQQFGASAGGFRGRFGGNRGESGFIGGEIISKDNKSVTVKLQDGG